MKMNGLEYESVGVVVSAQAILIYPVDFMGTKLEWIDEDPKDGELYLERKKSGETLMEVRSSANVQIACGNWV